MQFRMKRNLFIISLFALLLGCASTGYGQILSRGDFFGPGAPPARAGVELGLGLQTQSGSFLADCRCEFPDGKGSGFLANLVFELPVNYELAFSLKAGISFFHTIGDVPINDTATIVFSSPVDSITFGTIKFNRNGDVKATYFMLTPGVRYQFFRGGPFVSVGAGIGFLLSSHFTHKRELTSSTITLINDGSTLDNVRFGNGTREEVLQDGKIENAVTTRFSVIFGGGYDIPVSEKAILAPMVQYELPFTQIRNDSFSKNWKISQLMLMVGLKYILE